MILDLKATNERCNTLAELRMRRTQAKLRELEHPARAGQNPAPQSGGRKPAGAYSKKI